MQVHEHLADQPIVQGMDGSPLPHVDEYKQLCPNHVGLKLVFLHSDHLKMKSCY
jgi:hypothetical protein